MDHIELSVLCLCGSLRSCPPAFAHAGHALLENEATRVTLPDTFGSLAVRFVGSRTRVSA